MKDLNHNLKLSSKLVLLLSLTQDHICFWWALLLDRAKEGSFTHWPYICPPCHWTKAHVHCLPKMVTHNGISCSLWRDSIVCCHFRKTMNMSFGPVAWWAYIRP